MNKKQKHRWSTEVTLHSQGRVNCREICFSIGCFFQTYYPTVLWHNILHHT